MTCQKCGVRPATVDWGGDGGVLAWSHGMYQEWCEHCALDAQIEHAEAAAGRLSDLRRQRAELDRKATA